MVAEQKTIAHVSYPLSVRSFDMKSVHARGRWSSERKIRAESEPNASNLFFSLLGVVSKIHVVAITVHNELLHLQLLSIVIDKYCTKYRVRWDT